MSAIYSVLPEFLQLRARESFRSFCCIDRLTINRAIGGTWFR